MVEAERNFLRLSGPAPCSIRVIHISLPQTRFRKNRGKKHPHNLTECISFFLNAKSYWFVVFLLFFSLIFLYLLEQDGVFIKLEGNALLFFFLTKIRDFFCFFQLLNNLSFQYRSELHIFIPPLNLLQICSPPNAKLCLLVPAALADTAQMHLLLMQLPPE